jgi:asparagine synthase (glutamine-hydrolysing)
LLLALYGLLGSKMLSLLNGVFAIVIVDAGRHQVFAARDRLGAKPLYTWCDGNHFAFASEIAALRILSGNNEPDPVAIRQYAAMRAVFGKRTFFRSIESFPPGHFSINGISHRYWELDQRFEHPPDDHELRSLLVSAVDYRMVADVEVAALLSGGLDSTVTATLAGVRKTWCGGFSGDEDIAVAQRVADDLGFEHHTVFCDPREFVDTAREMLRLRGEPLCVPNEVLLYRLARDASGSGIRCLMTGEGADELFAGYDRIFSWAADAEEFDIEAFSARYCYGATPDLEMVEDAIAPYRKFGKPSLVVGAFFQCAHLGSLLRRLDHATMLAGVEAREPLADYRLVERLFGQPIAYKNAELGPKSPLKRVMRTLVPDYVIARQKVGFPVPLSTIFGASGGQADGYPSWFNFNLRELGWRQ